MSSLFSSPPSFILFLVLGASAPLLPWFRDITRREDADLQIGAMLISSGTGMALDAGVGRYRGFALLAIAMTGTFPLFLSLIWANVQAQQDQSAQSTQTDFLHSSTRSTIRNQHHQKDWQVHNQWLHYGYYRFRQWAAFMLSFIGLDGLMCL